MTVREVPANAEMAMLHDWLRGRLWGPPWTNAAALRTDWELEWDAALVFVDGSGTPIASVDEADFVVCQVADIDLCAPIVSTTVTVVAREGGCLVRGPFAPPVHYEYIACPAGIFIVTSDVAVGLGGETTASLAAMAALGQTGDIWLVHGRWDSAGASIPEPPAGWTGIGLGGALGGIHGQGQRGAWKAWDAADTSTGEWLHTHDLLIFLIRGAITADPIGAIAGGDNPSGIMGWDALTMEVTDGTSHVFAFGVHQDEDIADNPMSGSPAMTALLDVGSGQHASWYSDGGVASWGEHSITASGGDRLETAYEIRAAS